MVQRSGLLGTQSWDAILVWEDADDATRGITVSTKDVYPRDGNTQEQNKENEAGMKNQFLKRGSSRLARIMRLLTRIEGGNLSITASIVE